MRWKYLVLILVIFLSIALADDDEFSVRFHSFGKEVTIDLSKYLGDAENYTYIPASNVEVKITNNGTAIITAKQGWVGSEVITFVKQDYEKKEVPKTPTKSKWLVMNLEDIEENMNQEITEEFNSFFEDSIDSTLSILIESIETEELDLEKELSTKRAKLNLNNKINLDINTNSETTLIAMEILPGYELDNQKIKLTAPQIINERNLSYMYIILIIMVLIFYIYLILTNRIKTKPHTKIEKRQLKSTTIKLLNRIEPDSKDSMHELLDTFELFLIQYLGLRKNFSYDELIIKLKESKLSKARKQKALNIMKKISYELFKGHSSKWFDLYGNKKTNAEKIEKLIKNIKIFIRTL